MDRYADTQAPVAGLACSDLNIPYFHRLAVASQIGNLVDGAACLIMIVILFGFRPSGLASYLLGQSRHFSFQRLLE